MKSHIGRGVAVVLGAAMASGAAVGAEIYYQPLVTLSAETDSNIDLDAGSQPETQGYLADVGTVVGIDTPDSATIIRPRVVYRYYPQDSADDRLEGYLDFNSNYKSPRSNATVSGSFQHLDEFNAEYTEPVFNDINPVQGTPDTGRTVVGASRNSGLIAPKYTYSFTPTLAGGVSGQYQIVTYSPSDDTGHLNFDYYQGRAFLTWSATQRSDYSFGGFGSKFSTKDVFSEATGTGGLANVTTHWSPLLSTTAELIYQHTSVDTAVPLPLTESVNKVGGSVDVNYKTEVEKFHLEARRSISPSGGGAVYTTDRLQFQYDRSLTARFSVTGAVVGIRTLGLSENLADFDRKYADVLVEAHYFITPRLFLQGGAQYSWQKYQDQTNSADNTRVYIMIGYQGLGQQR